MDEEKRHKKEKGCISQSVWKCCNYVEAAKNLWRLKKNETKLSGCILRNSGNTKEEKKMII